MSTTVQTQVLGKIIGVHGVGGWVKVYSYTQPRENLLNYREFLAQRGGETRKVGFENCRVTGGKIFARITGCCDREEALSWVSTDLAVAVEIMPELAPDEYYWHQLQGLEVINLAGQRFGHVTRLLETSTHDVMVVKPDAQSLDERERMLPWVRGRVVVEVALDAGRVLVDWQADY